MPTIDPTTGKQLSGAQKAKRAKEREIVQAATAIVDGEATAFQPLTDVAPPPQRVDDIAVWAQIICQKVARRLVKDKAAAVPTAAAVVHMLRNLPKMRASATMSEQAVEVENDGRPIILDDDNPPLDPLAGPAWAYRRAAVVAYEILVGKRPVSELALASAELEVARLTCQFAVGHLVDILISNRT